MKKGFNNNLLLIIFGVIPIINFFYNDQQTDYSKNSTSDTSFLIRVSNQLLPDTYNHIDTLWLSNRDISVLKGSASEYKKIHNEYVRAEVDDILSIAQKREFLFISYMMAEIYNDPIASYDFVAIIEDSNIIIDSFFSAKIVKYLESSLSSKDVVLSFFSAQKLFNIYENGLFGIEKNKDKAMYYDSICFKIGKEFH